MTTSKILTNVLVVCLLLFGHSNASAWQQEPLQLKYCIDPGWLPYEGVKNGQHIGMSKDYIDLIAQKAAFNINLVATSSWQESIRLLQNGHCNLTPFLNYSPNRAEFLVFSKVIFTAPNVIITHGDSTPIPNLAMVKDETVGVVKGYRLQEYVTEQYPNVTLHEVANEIAGIRLLAKGDIDVMVGSMHTIVEHIHNNGLRNLRITGWIGLDDELRVGVAKEYAHILPAIDAAIADISAKQHNEIYRHWNNVKVVKEVDVGLLLKIVLPILMVSIILLIRHLIVLRYRKRIEDKNKVLESLQAALKKKNDKLQYLSTHDPLTDLYNRVKITAEAAEHIKRKNRDISECSLIFIDIDDFKVLNDHYGHNNGDAILEQFANALKSVARETDTIGRWGGDEFVVLCPGTLQPEAQHFAHRIQEALADTTFDCAAQVKCSIGVSELGKGDSLEQWLERADSAMYHAKSSGKNTVRTE